MLSRVRAVYPTQPPPPVVGDSPMTGTRAPLRRPLSADSDCTRHRALPGGNPAISDEEAELRALYAQSAEEDLELAEMGMADYARILSLEDRGDS